MTLTWLFVLILAGWQWPLDGLIRSAYWSHIGNDIGLNILIYIVLYGPARAAFVSLLMASLHLWLSDPLASGYSRIFEYCAQAVVVVVCI